MRTIASLIPALIGLIIAAAIMLTAVTVQVQFLL